MASGVQGLCPSDMSMDIDNHDSLLSDVAQGVAEQLQCVEGAIDQMPSTSPSVSQVPAAPPPGQALRVMSAPVDQTLLAPSDQQLSLSVGLLTVSSFTPVHRALPSPNATTVEGMVDQASPELGNMDVSLPERIETLPAPSIPATPPPVASEAPEMGQASLSLSAPIDRVVELSETGLGQESSRLILVSGTRPGTTIRTVAHTLCGSVESGGCGVFISGYALGRPGDGTSFVLECPDSRTSAIVQTAWDGLIRDGQTLTVSF